MPTNATAAGRAEDRPRHVVAYSLMSLDGVAEEPGDWMFEVDPEVFTFLGGVIARQDDVLLGRGTYDYWVDYWPTSRVEPFAGFINATPKHVFTSTPLGGEWAQTHPVQEPLVDYIESLRRRPGRDIGVHGSITLLHGLLAADLVDELHLVVVPTLAGGGTRLFPADARTPLRLACTHHSSAPSGTVFLSYLRRSDGLG